MRTTLVVAALAAGLIVAPAADAAIPQVFGGTASPVSCVVQTVGATAGQRFCGAAAATIPSWDGIRSTSRSPSRPRRPRGPTARTR
jgi:hypothetical protein